MALSRLHESLIFLRSRFGSRRCDACIYKIENWGVGNWGNQGSACGGSFNCLRHLAKLVLGGRRKRSAGRQPGISRNPKVLIFDFDGTVADTFQAGYEILNKLSVEFGFRRLERDQLEQARDMRTMQLTKFLGIRTTKMRRIAKRGSEELHQRIDSIKPFPEIPEILRELHARGYTLGIISSNTEENVKVLLRNHDLELFSFIRCSSKLLGKARDIKKVIKLHKLEPEDFYFIGDETRDIEAAAKAGIRIAAVTWGYNSRRALEALCPDRLFTQPQELLEFFPRI